MKRLPEWRCTRPAVYQNDDCPGRTNLSARQGYYIRANTASEALKIMASKFPEEASFGFDCQLWKSGD